MDFAKKQLEKYGWREGRGLGKNENGLAAALKPKLKFDNAGIGFDPAKEFTDHWWQRVYNEALDNVNVGTNVDCDVKINVNNPNGVDVSTNRYSVKKLKKNNKNGSNLEYGTFFKTSKLTKTGIVDVENNNCASSANIKDVADLCLLSDEQLFAACGGRTAHKGARHGLQLNGKLSRLEKQEKLLLKKLKNVSISDESKDSKEHIKKKLRKISKHKDKDAPDNMDEGMIDSPPMAVTSSSPHKNAKGRKKERKRVSFCESVTEYQTQDAEAVGEHESNAALMADTDTNQPSSLITMVRVVGIRSESNNNDQTLTELDEGIDVDIGSAVLNTKIKEENYKMKKKLKKLRKKYMSNVGKTEGLDESPVYQCIKRKLLEDFNEDRKRHCDENGDEKMNTNTNVLTKKELKMMDRRKKRLEKRLNRVTESLNDCKIKDCDGD